MKKAAFLFFRVEVGNAACAVQYLVVVQTMLGAFDFEEAREQSQAAQKEKKTGVA